MEHLAHTQQMCFRDLACSSGVLLGLKPDEESGGAGAST